MTQRLSTLSILVPDYDAGIAFFVGQLGFDLIEDTDQGRKRWVKVAPKGPETAFLLARAMNLTALLRCLGIRSATAGTLSNLRDTAPCAARSRLPIVSQT